MDLTERWCTVGNLRLHYLEAGRGRTMLFLHGFPQFWYEWRHQLHHFSADHHVVAVDQRGYNLSDKPPGAEAYRLQALIDDALGLCEKLSPEKPLVIVGHDWGALVAWWLAILHPERVARLVVINGPHPARFAEELTHDPAQILASSYMLLFRARLAERILSAFHHALLSRMLFGTSSRPEAFSDEDRRAYHHAWSQPGALTGGLNYYRANRLHPIAADTRVRVPTLLLWGERDLTLRPANTEHLEALVPDLRVRRIESGSHWVAEEEPARVNGLIREFVREGL
jgi:pimeloyl-ACP methyl ester carboxylesterase